MRTTSAFSITPLLLCGLLTAGGARAQSSPAQGMLDNRFVGSLGGFIFSTDTEAQLNGRSVTNPNVDFDQEFGKPSDSNRIRFDGLWRITPAHHLRLLYFDNTIERTRNIQNTINWGDYTFQAGANVDYKNKSKIFELAYEYAFVHQPTYEVSGTIGVHYMDVTVSLSGAATITDANGNVTQASFATKTSSVPMPLPVIGLRGGWVVAPQWYLEAQAQFFKADIGDVNGHVNDLRASATWMFVPGFGVGLGYNRFTTNVDVSKPSYNGSLKFGYSGLQLFATGTF